MNKGAKHNLKTWILPIARLCCMILGGYFLVDGIMAVGLLQFLDYFTYLSNVIVFVALGLLLLGVCGRTFFLYTTSYITVTFVVYGLLLSPGLGKESFLSLVLHAIVPIFVILDFTLFSVPKQLSYKKVFGSLIIPLCYGAYILIFGAIKGTYPYFFVDVHEVGYFGFFISALFIALGLLILGGLYTFINNVRVYNLKKKSPGYPV